MDHDHGHMHDGMEGMMAPPKAGSSGSTMGHGHMHGMMHMTFFWGKDALVLFDHWPAGKSSMYALSLIFVFLMAVLVEILSRTRFIKPGSNPIVAGLVQTLVHTLRVGLAYLVMLALMSFNGGIFLVAVLGHGVGFFFFSKAFYKPQDNEASDLPPFSCP